ncbi:6464_t:CDS:2 [Acaulospora colombiana]|uniref:6464_t:CDS:1 n=1 Tax=Acaulospora colombiana TaxID=27376 RepID=A0ACA9MWV2_9GLOM|nr:6464_t:CDS:2 [Acaulospora colombiana]
MKLDKSDSQISSKEIWESAINTLLTALENILLDENGMPIKQGSTEEPYEQKATGQASADTMMEEFESSFGSLSPLKRKRENGDQRKNKSQKLLSSKLARNLSLSEDESNEESIPPKTDAHMDFCNINSNSSNSSRPFQRNVKKCSRQLFGGRCDKPTVPLNNNTLDMDMALEHHTVGGDTSKVHEPERIQMLRRIMSDFSDSYHSWSVAMSDWIELQAQKRNMSLQEFQVQFQERTRDAESFFTILHGSIPHVYDEIRVSVDRFLLNANWLRCDYSKPFIQNFPQWQPFWGKKLENIVQYVEIVEDMKATVNYQYPQSEDSNLDMKKIREFLEFKKSLYGEILQQDGLTLATAYTEWELSQIKRVESKIRGVEVRMMHICDNINHVLHYLHIIQAAEGQDASFTRENDHNVSPAECQQNLKILEKFSTALVETGLRLCEHIIKPKTSAVTGPSNFVYMYSEFLVRFVSRALEFTGLAEAAETRMRPLLASLKNMENAAKFG